jgi:ADP-heptose:LPS heptosyltransferase
LGGLEAVTRLIRGADLVVSVNTGIMHLAAIAGAPTVSLNGPNSDRRWGPRGANVFSLESPKCGCGYLNLGFEHDDGPADCMEATTVEHVLAAVSELLGATAFNASREPNTAV